MDSCTGAARMQAVLGTWCKSPCHFIKTPIRINLGQLVANPSVLQTSVPAPVEVLVSNQRSGSARQDEAAETSESYVKLQSKKPKAVGRRRLDDDKFQLSIEVLQREILKLPTQPMKDEPKGALDKIFMMLCHPASALGASSGKWPVVLILVMACGYLLMQIPSVSSTQTNQVWMYLLVLFLGLGAFRVSQLAAGSSAKSITAETYMSQKEPEGKCPAVPHLARNLLVNAAHLAVDNISWKQKSAVQHCQSSGVWVHDSSEASVSSDIGTLERSNTSSHAQELSATQSSNMEKPLHALHKIRDAITNLEIVLFGHASVIDEADEAALSQHVASLCDFVGIIFPHGAVNSCEDLDKVVVSLLKQVGVMDAARAEVS